MTYGVTAEGFVRPSMQEILADRRQRYRDMLGPVNTGPESVIGQMIGAESDREDRLWQAMEAVYFSQYPRSAGDRSLDGAVQLTGVSRLPATRSIVTAVLIGVPGSNISAESQASVDGTGAIFETVGDTLLSPAEIIQALIEVETVEAETDYTVTIDGTEYTYNSSADPDEAEILDGLLAELPASVDGSVEDDALSLIAEDRVTEFSLSVTANLSIEEVGVTAQMRSVERGNILAFAETLTQIETPVAGWDEVTNYLDATAGREIESDAELRIRRRESLQIAGTATVEAIRSGLLQNVEDVTAATVIENRTDTVDGDGRPPHSFEAVVSGGLDQDVADRIWALKAAGIETAGGETVTVTDSTGEQHAIRFSRPVDVYVWLKVEVNLNGVGSFPEDGEASIQDALVEYGQSLSVGDNILHQALYGPVYQTPGIATVTVGIATSASPSVEPDPGEYVTENVTIASNEITLWSTDRIEVTVNE